MADSGTPIVQAAQPHHHGYSTIPITAQHQVQPNDTADQK